MKAELKAMRDEIHRYFGNIPHRIKFVESQKRTFVDIEYEDFLNEQHVEEAVRGITGGTMTVIVKRECSNALMEKIKASFAGGYTVDELFDRMEEYEEIS